MTSLFVAAKMEEVYPPKAQEMAATNAAMMRAYKSVSGPPAMKLLKSGMSVRELGRLWSRKRLEARDYDVTDELVSGTADPNVKRLLRELVDFGHIDVSLAADLQRAGARRSIAAVRSGTIQVRPNHAFSNGWISGSDSITDNAATAPSTGG